MSPSSRPPLSWPNVFYVLWVGIVLPLLMMGAIAYLVAMPPTRTTAILSVVSLILAALLMEVSVRSKKRALATTEAANTPETSDESEAA